MFIIWTFTEKVYQLLASHIVFMMANFDLLRCRHNILPLNTLACITWEYVMVISKISVNFQVIVFLLCFYYVFIILGDDDTILHFMYVCVNIYFIILE